MTPGVSQVRPAVLAVAPASSKPPPSLAIGAPAIPKPTAEVLTQPQSFDLPAFEIRVIMKALFPAATWVPAPAAAKTPDKNATYCTCPRTGPHSCGRFTTISGMPYAERLQALETTQQVQYDPHPRLCSHTGRGKKDADGAESKHRAEIFSDFCHTIQSCTNVATASKYDIDEVIRQLAVSLGVANDPLLASAEFDRAGNTLKWAIVFWVFVKTSMARYIGELELKCIKPFRSERGSAFVFC
ncbi:hypothetical protein A1O7_09554 [Cladophialophora yegresii CBS 114405]|uniref:Uncharacterized protein n=1 Tax=Cladophialophora yegresii CBS 114405 TaxID=1182544 RepID=W9VF15_9EURO|nr:uncharacterized protein A1O7_09554 [Cladophialophora yegresii CBS 114405]EXJ54217.1 hypothetical protein A1O7_09554 [Cladophialophora yegresii CBS 114405]